MATPGGTSARVCAICKSVIVDRRCAGDEPFLCVYCTSSCQAQQETVLQLKEEMIILVNELVDLCSTVETLKKASKNDIAVLADSVRQLTKNLSSLRRTADPLRGKLIFFSI